VIDIDRFCAVHESETGTADMSFEPNGRFAPQAAGYTSAGRETQRFAAQFDSRSIEWRDCAVSALRI